MPVQARPCVKDKEELKSQGYKILGVKKRKDLALAKFIDPNNAVYVIVAVKALDEGVDIPSIECAIQVAYTSTGRQDIQRNGRAGSIDYNNLEKKALIINLYMMGTQEEKWLREKQKDANIAVHWVESIEQINVNKVISLASLSHGEIEIKESDIESGVSRDNSEVTSS